MHWNRDVLESLLAWPRRIYPKVKQGERKIMAGIFLLTLLIRLLLVVLAVYGNHTTAEGETGQIARNLVQGNGYALERLVPGIQPSAHKSPLYPIFLAGVLAFFPGEWDLNPSTHFSRAHMVVWLIQGVVASFAAVLLYKLGKRAFGAPTGILSALIFAVCPYYAYPHLHVSRVVFDIFLTTLLLLLNLRFISSPSIRLSIAYGVVAGLLLLLNPVYFLFIVLAQIYFFLRTYRDLSVAVTLKLQAVCFTVIALLLLPWVFRNYVAFHQFIPFSSNFPYEIWVGNHPGASGDIWDADLNATTSVPDSILAETLAMSEPERYQYLGKLGLEYMLANPGRALALRVLSGLQFWFGPMHLKFFTSLKEHWFFTLLFFLNFPMVLMSWGGLLVSLKSRRDPNVLFGLLFLGVSIPYVLTHGGGERYRAGLTPVFALYVSNLLIYVFQLLRQKAHAGKKS
jgi:4-amino-4-deoxy-L-arabinose transferase-like glycosyltransferase